MLPAAILMGGVATRLRPITEKIPKSLVEINGEPFLAHQLRLLYRRGIRRVVFCVGHLAEQIEAFAGDGSRFGLEASYSFDGPVLKGTAGAIRQALPLLGEAFFVVYGDSYLPCDYSLAQRTFEHSGKLSLMTVHRNEGRWDSSNVEFESGVIRAYDKVNKTPRMRYIDYGLGAFHRDAFADMAEDCVRDLATVYQDLLQRDQLAALEIGERFYEIGSFAGIEELSALLNAGDPKLV